MENLQLTKAYCQVNLLKGNRYLDDAGKIMNLYDEEFPEKSVGIEGLSMVNKGADLEELRVSTVRIWFAFREPDTRQYVYDQARRRIDEIVQIIHVTHARRFGLRLEQIWAVPEADRDSVVTSVADRVYDSSLLAKEGTISSFEVMVETKHESVDVILRVRPVRRAKEAGPDDHLPDFGIMFDTDISTSGKELPISDIRKFFRGAERWLKESMPALADQVMSEVSQ